MEDADKNSKSLVLITRVGSTPTTGIASSSKSKDFGLLFFLSPHIRPVFTRLSPPGVLLYQNYFRSNRTMTSRYHRYGTMFQIIHSSIRM